MAMTTCKECGSQISTKAARCPRCGAPVKRKTSVLTWIITSILVLGFLAAISTDPNRPASGIAPTATAPKTLPVSYATYAEVDREVGCSSTYSDDKKRDLFNSKYKDHFMEWSGDVVLSEASKASLNIDGKGTQDLQVRFSDQNAGYNLEKGKKITVEFIMSSAGGCFLPFGGYQAVITK